MVDSSTTVGELRERVRQFVRARDWERFHTPKDLATAVSIETSELLEIFLWRGSTRAEEISPVDRASAAEELADIVIYVLSLANALHLDLSDAVLSKLKKDEAKYPVDRFRGVAP